MQIFISSPCETLKNERKIIYNVLQKLGFNSIFLSEFEKSRSESSYSTCFSEILKSNLFILILGKHYGTIPENEYLSVTEQEYDCATKNNIETLVFKLDFFEYEPRQKEFIKKVENFYKGNFRGATISNIKELEERIYSDIPQHFVKRSEANKIVAVKEILKTEKLVKFKETAEVILDNEIDFENLPLLLLKARLNYDSVVGTSFIAKFLLNGIELSEENLINKPLRYTLADKREFNWYDKDSRRWCLAYSPNFKDNYYHLKYNIVNGDPYTFIFSLKNITLNKKKNILKIVHLGDDNLEAHKNAIIIGKYELIK